MRLLLAAIVLALLASGCIGAEPLPPASGPPETSMPPAACPAPGWKAGDLNATIETSKGQVRVVLHAAQSPLTVCNFLTYVAEDFYDNTVWHRICPHVIQAGGYDPVTMTQKRGHDPIKNEAPQSRLRNYQGTLGMARSADPDSATSHFYINNRDNNYLDYDGQYAPGYAVFGNVTAGWPVVQEIANTQTLPSAQGCAGQPVPSMETRIFDVALSD